MGCRKLEKDASVSEKGRKRMRERNQNLRPHDTVPMIPEEKKVNRMETVFQNYCYICNQVSSLLSLRFR